MWAVASRTLTSIPDATLSAATIAAIATAVEQSILNEGDGTQVLNAIVGAIGNTNVDEVALVAAIRVDLERAGGSIDLIETKAEARQALLIAEHDATQASISSGGVDLTKLDELHAIHGLDAANPMTVTPASRTAGSITQAITGDGEASTTVTRT